MTTNRTKFTGRVRTVEEHILRERVLFHAPGLEVTDLSTGLSSRNGTTVELPADVLRTLLDRLDELED